MTDLSQYTGTWTIDPTHTTLGFAARHALVTKVRGSFQSFAGTLVLDGADPAASTAEVTIDAVSITTGNADRDAHLRSGDFFDAEHYPTISFRSTGVRQRGDDFVLVGDLTIKDVTRPVELAVELGGVLPLDPFGNVRAGFEATAEISRSDFGLTWNLALETGGLLLGDKIRLQLDVAATRVSEPAVQPV
ncbi:MAG: polyisoprenoid-binding protein [Actinomycetota bacterium]|nr:MAG: polyisoprenoid-binding protein [Actinomycetota bacterium]